MRVISGLSGNEIYCLNMMGLGAGDLVVGNSVYSLGVAGSVGSALRTLAGGEVEAVTNIIRDGRLSAYQRMLSEAKKRHACGIISVSSTVVHHGDNVEFLAIGSAVYSTQPGDSQAFFSASADGQELYCQSDAGFEPVEFVFGNVVYALGVGRSITAGFRSFARGEIKEMSDMLNAIRHLAIERIAAEASAVGANAVLGIHTSVRPIAGAQEMIMSGTACRTPHLLVRDGQVPITSDLTSQETWNLARVGILPLQLVLGVSVYSVGVVGSFSASVRGLVRGEIPELTNVLYEARTNAMERMAADAGRCGADGVLGVQTYVYDMGEGVVEFLAIGTAVKQVNGSSTRSNSLPTQVVIKDEETFTTMNPFSVLLNTSSGATASLSGGGSLGGLMFFFGLWILIIGGMALFVFVAPFRHFVVQFFR